jgi:hypothetical protein
MLGGICDKRDEMEKQSKTARLEVRADPAWLKRLDALRKLDDELPTRAEALRRLVDQLYEQRVSNAA